jgi:hypothetical protein
VRLDPSEHADDDALFQGSHAIRWMVLPGQVTGTRLRHGRVSLSGSTGMEWAPSAYYPKQASDKGEQQ